MFKTTVSDVLKSICFYYNTDADGYRHQLFLQVTKLHS